MFRIPLVLSGDANTPPFEGVWDWATALSNQSSSRRLTRAVWKKGSGRLRLRRGNEAGEAAELTRLGRPLAGLVAGICPTYRVACRAEVAECPSRVGVVRPLSESGRCRGKRGSHHHCRDPSQHWLFHRVYNHVDFFANPARPSGPIPNRESEAGSTCRGSLSEGLGCGQQQHILELYDLPATVRIDDLEARKLPTLFLDVELARLVYHMV
jgi:hypothetical protein